jgi:hypothetical protein
VSTYDLVAGLPLEVDGYELEGLAQQITPEFERRTTVIHLRGGGEEGIGEDVTYDPAEHELQQQLGPVLDLAGVWTLDAFSRHLEDLDAFPQGEPQQPAYRLYRRWGFESAALDLALRQAGRSLADVLAREPSPVTFVVSLRLDQPPSFEPIAERLLSYPGLRFKLDATPDWSEELIARLAGTGAVDSIDFKGAYKGTPVDVGTDPVLYQRIVDAFPDAWLEDPDLDDPEARAILEPHRDRVTWDAPIHSVADITGRLWPPRTVNLKPSRFGPVRALFDAYDHCAAHGMGAYGGGQFELGPGRGQIQYLAALFHPDAPNDIAPGGYNAREPAPGLPSSPLEPELEPVGFRRRDVH